MNDEDIKRIIEDNYDDAKADSLRSMVKAFYGRKMRWMAVNIWIWFAVFLFPLIFSVVKFFGAEQTKDQIMYAAIFVCCIVFMGTLKVLGWVMLSKHLIGREVKRLELRIAELNETIKKRY